LERERKRWKVILEHNLKKKPRKMWAELIWFMIGTRRGEGGYLNVVINLWCQWAARGF